MKKQETAGTTWVGECNVPCLEFATIEKEKSKNLIRAQVQATYQIKRGKGRRKRFDYIILPKKKNPRTRRKGKGWGVTETTKRKQ